MTDTVLFALPPEPLYVFLYLFRPKCPNSHPHKDMRKRRSPSLSSRHDTVRLAPVPSPFPRSIWEHDIDASRRSPYTHLKMQRAANTWSIGCGTREMRRPYSGPIDSYMLMPIMSSWCCRARPPMSPRRGQQCVANLCNAS